MISFIAPAFQYYPILLPSLIDQKNPNWEVIILHDTFNEKYVRIIEEFNDPRIKLYFSKERMGKWGHPLRQKGLEYCSNDSDIIIHTNADNYYVPSFVEAFENGIGDKIGVYCDCIHSHYRYDILYTSLTYGKIDCGCFAVQSAVAKEIGWKSMEFEADWHYMEEVIQKYSFDAFNKIHQCLFVHN